MKSVYQSGPRTVVFDDGRSRQYAYPITSVEVDGNLVFIRQADEARNRVHISVESGVLTLIELADEFDFGVDQDRRGVTLPSGTHVRFATAVRQVLQFHDRFLVIVERDPAFPTTSNALLISWEGEAVWLGGQLEPRPTNPWLWAECQDGVHLQLFNGGVGVDVDPESGRILNVFDHH